MFRKENQDKEVLQTVWERSDQSRGEVLHDLWRNRGRRGDRRRNVSGDRRLTRRTHGSNCRRHRSTSGAKAAFKLRHGRNKDVYYLIGPNYRKMNQLGQALEAYRQFTSGVYASVSQSAVKNLEKKVGKVNAK
jgi:hypothetical protein